MTNAGTAGAPAGAGLELLTRRDCAGTPLMLERLRSAVARLDAPLPCVLVDLATLAADDVRRGYPTPTVLVHGVDLFGLEASASRRAPT